MKSHAHASEHGDEPDALPEGHVERDPVCAMTIGTEANPARASLHEGRRFRFCSERCQSRFEAAPGDFIEAPDPICGMTVDRASARYTARHGGESRFFCSPRCLARFEAEPERFADGPPTPEPMPAGTRYTCPMHPEIVRDEFGDCPICGMALEPVGAPAGDSAPNPELVDFTRRFWVSAACAVPLLLLTMGPMVGLPFREWLGERPALWIEFLLATPVVLWAATPFFVRGWRSIRTRHLNMWTLIAIGVGAAYAYSVVALLAPGIFPPTFREMNGTVAVYFEAAAVIVALVFLGQLLELRARERTGSAIRALLDLAPKTARRIEPDGSEQDVPLEDIVSGDALRVRPGDSVPLDGEIVEGTSRVDESMITGEPAPVAKGPGDEVTGGTLNGTGSFVMRATRVGSDTVLARIVELVATAQRSRAPIQALADRVAAWFVPLVLAIAAIALVLWGTLGPEPRMAFAIVAAVSVLIIACPCALGLATPMSITTAMGRGAQAGVLIRDAESLERFARVDTLVVDKTGTLTEGRPALTDLVPAEGLSEEALLGPVAALERGSEHPLAEAIVEAAHERGLELGEVRDFEAVPGRGVQGRVEDVPVAIGNAAFMGSLGVSIAPLEARADALSREGKTAMYVAIDGRAGGVLAVEDPIKATTKGAIDALHEAGLRIVMATGDDERTANAIAARLGMDEVHAGVMPEDKQRLVEALRAGGASIAMAGDGVNDAPALAAADVGVAMGSGSDVAVESAGVTLLGGDLQGLVRARRLGRATLTNIRQNLFLAFVYNGLGVPIAAGALYPWTGWLLSPMIAAAAMSLSSVSVITNALRLRAVRLE